MEAAMFGIEKHWKMFQVKPLGVIWGKFPQWNEKNTIMFDDIRRNFIMNPNNGLRVSADVVLSALTCLTL